MASEEEKASGGTGKGWDEEELAFSSASGKEKCHGGAKGKTTIFLIKNTSFLFCFASPLTSGSAHNTDQRKKNAAPFSKNF